MERKYSFLCDCANVSQTGNLNVLGIFDNIAAANFPCTHPQCFYIAKIEAFPTEVGQHPFRLSLVDEDGGEVIPAIGGLIHFARTGLSTNLMLKMVNLGFQKPGVYRFDLTIDGKYFGTETITVSRMQQQNG